MGPLLLVLLYPLSCVSGLPFYNGFYYSNNPSSWNSHGEGAASWLWLYALPR